MWNKILGLLKKYREQLLYLIFGGLTTLISWGTSSFLYYFVFGKTNTLLSNIISEVIAITFAYITNKLFVFRSKTATFKSFIKELLMFYALRILSTVVNLGAMQLCVEVLKWEFWICKILINVIVIILNYVFSKLWIFNKDKSTQSGNLTDIKDESENTKATGEKQGEKNE